MHICADTFFNNGLNGFNGFTADIFFNNGFIGLNGFFLRSQQDFFNNGLNGLIGFLRSHRIRSIRLIRC